MTGVLMSAVSSEYSRTESSRQCSRSPAVIVTGRNSKPSAMQTYTNQCGPRIPKLLVSVLLIGQFVDMVKLANAQPSNAANAERQSRSPGFAGGLFGSRWNVSPATPRFLSLFTIVQWGQSLCQAPSGEYGTCVPNNECAVRGGIPGGPCAEGYGMCCVFMASCGGVARDNGTYFVNPSHPDPYDGTGSCQLTVQKIHPDICQIRLDFDNFAIAQPEPINHICNTDQFLVSGGSPAPTICGTSHGDHMYVDTGVGQSNPIIVTVITSGSTRQRTWRIRITQIPCTSIAKADQGCLQYHSGVYGRVRSFNFGTASGRQLSNQEYSVCVRTERNFCSIQYQSCPDLVNNRTQSFTISGNAATATGAVVGGATQGGANTCSTDWLLIGCAKVADKVPVSMTCEDRICGTYFSAEAGTTQKTVTTNIRPFRLAYHTDAVEMAAGDVNNRGFCLDYVQQPCTNGK